VLPLSKAAIAAESPRRADVEDLGPDALQPPVARTLVRARLPVVVTHGSALQPGCVPAVLRFI
jgi:hypothetical protein